PIAGGGRICVFFAKAPGLATWDCGRASDRPGNASRTTRIHPMSTRDLHDVRMQRAQLALEGLSLGDSFGERFFESPLTVDQRIEHRSLPSTPWTYTDDTVMAISICEVLEAGEGVDRDRLATAFAARYLRDRHRGYGGTAHEILRRIADG